jgi:hypothetical protein
MAIVPAMRIYSGDNTDRPFQKGDIIQHTHGPVLQVNVVRCGSHMVKCSRVSFDADMCVTSRSSSLDPWLSADQCWLLMRPSEPDIGSAEFIAAHGEFFPDVGGQSERCKSWLEVYRDQTTGKVCADVMGRHFEELIDAVVFLEKMSTEARGALALLGNNSDKPGTTKFCDACGGLQLVLLSSQNEKHCSSCGHVMKWELAEGQKPAI